MSDRGLAKLCDRHHIPLPTRGYWAKVNAGQFPAMMPLPRPDQDFEIQLRDLLHEQVGKVPVDLQSDEFGAYKLADVAIPPSEEGSTTIKRKRGRPTKTSPTVPKKIPERGESEKDNQLVSGGRHGVIAAHEDEFNMAVEAGFEFQKRKAAELALAEIQRCLPYVEPGLALAMTKWAQRVQQRLNQSNPIEGVIYSIRKALDDSKRSTW